MMQVRQNSSPFAAHESHQTYPVKPIVEPFLADVAGMLGERRVITANRGVRLLQRGGAPLVFLPPSSLSLRHLRASDTLRVDDYGLAVHLHLTGNGYLARDALWYYPGPDPELAVIAGMICVDPSRLGGLYVNGMKMCSGKLPGTWEVESLLPARQQGAA